MGCGFVWANSAVLGMEDVGTTGAGKYGESIMSKGVAPNEELAEQQAQPGTGLV